MTSNGRNSTSETQFYSLVETRKQSALEESEKPEPEPEPEPKNRTVMRSKLFEDIYCKKQQLDKTLRDIRSSFFMDVTQCRLVDSYGRSETAYRLQLQG